MYQQISKYPILTGSLEVFLRQSYGRQRECVLARHPLHSTDLLAECGKLHLGE